jgi:hypothetical protein
MPGPGCSYQSPRGHTTGTAHNRYGDLILDGQNKKAPADGGGFSCVGQSTEGAAYWMLRLTQAGLRALPPWANRTTAM